MVSLTEFVATLSCLYRRSGAGSSRERHREQQHYVASALETQGVRTTVRSIPLFHAHQFSTRHFEIDSINSRHEVEAQPLKKPHTFKCSLQKEQAFIIRCKN